MSKLLVYGLAAVGGYVLLKQIQAAKDNAAALAARSAALKADVQAMLPGMGDDDDHLLLPPPGRTISASGQVLGGLGFDVYDAAPYQYRRDVINDLGDLGWGVKSVTRAVSNVAKVAVAPVVAINQAVLKTVAPVIKTVQKAVENPLTKALSVVDPVSFQLRLAANTANIIAKAASNPAGAFKMIKQGVKSFTVTPLMQTGMVLGIVKPPKMVAADGGTAYVDSQGKPISKAEYDALVAAAEKSKPQKALDYKGYGIWTYTKPEGGVLYLINYDAVQNACEGAYESMSAAQAAIDGVSVPAGTFDFSASGGKNAGWNVVNFAQAYNGHAISTLTSGAGGGVVYLIDVPAGSDGSGLTNFPTMAAAQAAIDAQSAPAQSLYQPQQAPATPAVSYSVQTPSAQVDTSPAPAPAPAPAPKSNAGLLVGGGLLAATAGLFFMNR